MENNSSNCNKWLLIFSLKSYCIFFLQGDPKSQCEAPTCGYRQSCPKMSRKFWSKNFGCGGGQCASGKISEKRPSLCHGKYYLFPNLTPSSYPPERRWWLPCQILCPTRGKSIYLKTKTSEFIDKGNNPVFYHGRSWSKFGSYFEPVYDYEVLSHPWKFEQDEQ